MNYRKDFFLRFSSCRLHFYWVDALDSIAGSMAALCQPTTTAATSPISAANDNHSAGMARLPVTWMRYVQTAGVNPPKIAVARLNATEKPVVLISGGMISARYGTIAPL